MIRLNGIELNNNLQWAERFTVQSVAQSVRRTLAGNMVIYAGQLNKGENITLVGSEDYGWLTKTQVEAIRAIAQIPMVIYTLEFDGQFYQVVFRHHEAPAIEFRPLVHRETHENTDYFIGTIKLMTV